MRKILTLCIVVLIFVATCLQGCSSKADKADNQADGQTVLKQDGEADQDNDKTMDKETVMGRFIEKKIDLPEVKEGERIIKFLQNSEGQLELYIQSEGGYQCYYLKENKDWESSEAGWLEDIPKSNNVEVVDLCYGEDGNYYLCYADYDEEGQCHIIKSVDGGITSIEIELSYLKEKISMENYQLYPMIQGIEVTENGNLVLYNLQTDKELLIFSPQGDKLDKVRIATSNMEEAYFVASGNNIITLSEENKVAFYSTESKTLVKSVECDEMNGSTAFTTDVNGTVFMGNKNGIHRLAKDGTIWETTVDGALNSMSMPTMHMNGLYVLPGDEEQYYAAYSNDNGTHMLMHYVYDREISAVPSTELTVYSLGENGNIRQAISLFQTKYPDVKINYVVAMGEEEGNVTDYIRSLNTELLAGSGADILVLDGLPVSSYLQKGVLADISEIFNNKELSDKLLTNITNSFSVKGRIYQMPIRFTMPIIFGKQEAISAITNMDGIVNYIKKSSEPFTAPVTFHNLLQDYLALYSKDLFQKEKLSPDKLKLFLENLKAIANNIGAVEYDESADDLEAVDQGYIPNNRLFRLKMTGLIKNEYSASMCQFANIGSALIPLVVMDKSNTSYETMNHTFLPVGMVGLNKASQETDVAKKFIAFLYSEEVQDGDLYDGFPVNKWSLQKWINRESTDTFAFSVEGGVMLEGSYPDKEVREGILKVIEDVNTPIELNQEVLSILIKEMLPYFTDELTIDQVIAAAETKINTYLAE